MTTLAAFPAIDEDTRGGEAFVDRVRLAIERPQLDCKWPLLPPRKRTPSLLQRINFCHENFTMLNAPFDKLRSIEFSALPRFHKR